MWELWGAVLLTTTCMGSSVECVGHVNVSGDNLASGCLERSYIILHNSPPIDVRVEAFGVCFV